MIREGIFFSFDKKENDKYRFVDEEAEEAFFMLLNQCFDNYHIIWRPRGLLHDRVR